MLHLLSANSKCLCSHNTNCELYIAHITVSALFIDEVSAGDSMVSWVRFHLHSASGIQHILVTIQHLLYSARSINLIIGPRLPVTIYHQNCFFCAQDVPKLISTAWSFTFSLSKFMLHTHRVNLQTIVLTQTPSSFTRREGIWNFSWSNLTTHWCCCRDCQK